MTLKTLSSSARVPAEDAPVASVSAAVPLSPGDVIAQSYRIEREIGAGGMGVVLAARHLYLDEPVAIKIMAGHAARDPNAVARFRREARAAIRLKSPHVVRVMDVGSLETGEPFIAMELLDGSDLATILTQQGPLPVAKAVDLVLQSLEAVAEAHALGIVHRDLKPANLFITRTPDGADCVKVLDFGISKAVTADSGGLTRSCQVVGSPLYMSPEQLAATRDLDERSDIWSIGVVLYEALTGQRPFRGETLPQLCVAVLNHDPVPIREVRPEVPKALDQAVLRCLQKNASQRPADVGELAVAIAPFGPPESAASARRAVRTLRTADPRTDGSALRISSDSLDPPPLPKLEALTLPSSGDWIRPTARSARGRAVAIAAGAVVVACIVVAGWVLVTRDTSQPAPPTGHPAMDRSAQIAQTSDPPDTSSPPAEQRTEDTVPTPKTAAAAESTSPVTPSPQRDTAVPKPSAQSPSADTVSRTNAARPRPPQGAAGRSGLDLFSDSK